LSNLPVLRPFNGPVPDYSAAKISRQEPLRLSIREDDFFAKNAEKQTKTALFKPFSRASIHSKCLSKVIDPPDKVPRQIA
jgi:hypothetical protein